VSGVKREVGQDSEEKIGKSLRQLSPPRAEDSTPSENIFIFCNLGGIDVSWPSTDLSYLLLRS
jgi:hypothetical protein